MVKCGRTSSVSNALVEVVTSGEVGFPSQSKGFLRRAELVRSQKIPMGSVGGDSRQKYRGACRGVSYI